MDAPASHKKSLDGKKGMVVENIGLLLGILSCLMFGIFTGIPAVIMGHTSLNRKRKEPESHINERIAKAGIFLGYLGILLYVVLALALFLIYSNPKSHWDRL